MIWSTIIDALKDVQETLSRNPDYAQKDVLPSELREALLRLSGCLSDVMDLFTQHTYESTVCSAPLRNHFSALPKEESQGRRPRRYELLGPELAIESRGPVDETSNWGILYKTISTIWFHGEPIVYGPLMIEMDRRMREDKNLKKTMTPYVRERLNDIVLCSHCHAQMQRFQPWAVSSNFNILVPDEADNSNTSNDDDDPEAPKLSDDHFRTELVWLEYDAKQELEGLDIQTLLKGFLNPDLDYSVENLLTNPSEAQTVKNQTLERTLDDFWAKIDGGLGQKLSQRSDLPLDQVFPIAGPFRFRTPDWDEEAVNAAMRKRAEKARTPEKKRKRYESFTGGPTTGRKILKLVAQHKKQKTRPDPSGNIAQGGQEVATAEEVEEVQIFELDDRNMDVVPQLWQTGEVAPRLAWKDLRRFMQDLGFEETHVEGSIWKFDAGPSDKLKERGITGSINIHDPHAVKFEDRERPHAIGSRLFKLWGWRPESFVEKGGMDELLRD
ncbi:hypothetical protein N7456_011995 [Penicillium angulare]|uniref:Uncharacterized protein n=1 Tax=Penicillium angulare TaxID=116970 RepID=A0A9W9K088_9EURO|nr:hypothetical protein N7456_011995 [Penicillium angulare]